MLGRVISLGDAGAGYLLTTGRIIMLKQNKYSLKKTVLSAEICLHCFCCAQ